MPKKRSASDLAEEILAACDPNKAGRDEYVAALMIAATVLTAAPHTLTGEQGKEAAVAGTTAIANVVIGYVGTPEDKRRMKEHLQKRNAENN